jgi:putative membrane protein
VHWSNYGWGMGFGWFFMIFFWILIIFGIVYLVKLLTTDKKGNILQDSPLDILKKRYAKGEITKEEYEKIKSDLEKNSH